MYRATQMNVEWAEVVALKEGIVLAHNNNITKAIFETGCVSLVNHFKNHWD
ncbi:hypothetical protein Goarm_000579 [Gossypium armourianum]|uniref:RNase H type-1 domain-containing protein n=1 Tax=Gossypium armourianum TaxID=34283 RepID=A0A7J9KAB5_9ROSI|nr:hypothetical protein [Gossypium armourianum]